jgi:hypothetical protein
LRKPCNLAVYLIESMMEKPLKRKRERQKGIGFVEDCLTVLVVEDVVGVSEFRSLELEARSFKICFGTEAWRLLTLEGGRTWDKCFLPFSL